MQQTEQLISDDVRNELQAFVTEMQTMFACDEELGRHLEVELLDGVTFVMDWYYLDAPSTYLCINVSAQGYDPERTDVRHLCDNSDTMDQLDSELAATFGSGFDAEYDESNSMDEMHVWHVFGVNPF